MMHNHFTKYRKLFWIVPFFLLAFSSAAVSAQDGVLPLPGGNSRAFLPVTQLSASPSDLDAKFGHAVAIDESWLVVGAPYYGTSGAAFVFQRSAVGVWMQQALLVGSDTAADDEFGYSVAIDGSTIMVGARRQGAEDKGAVYVFINSGGTWTQKARLQPTLNNFAYFGRQVAIDGNRAVIAASGIGAAYLYQRDALGQWALEVKLPTTVFDTYAVDIDGTRVAVSSLTEDTYAGAVYLYEPVGGVWTQTAHLTASDAFGYHYFGFSMELRGNLLFVGRYPQPPPTRTLSDSRAISSGAVYVFQYGAGVWSEQQILTASDSTSYDSFGHSLAAQGDVLMIGSFEDEALAGSVYRFDRAGTVWSETSKIEAVGGRFSYSLDLDEGTLVGGAPEADGEGGVTIYSDPALQPVELLVDGGFEVSAAGWEIKNATGDKVKCNKPTKTVAYAGNCAWRFKSAAGENAKIQQIMTSGVASGDTLELNGYVSATGAVDSKVKVVVKYVDTTLPKSKITVEVVSQTAGYVGLSGFQPVLSADVIAPIDKIKVMVKNSGASGKVFYDSLSLTAR
jgi:hypothetical protein